MVNKRCIAALAVFLAAAVFGAFGISRANKTLLDPIDKVEFTAVDTFGDPSAADGLKAEIVEDSGILLRHHYSLKAGSSPQTIVSHELSREALSSGTPSKGLYISLDLLNSRRVQDHVDEQLWALPEGQSKTISFRARDIYEYYPLQVTWSLQESGIVDNGFSEYGESNELYRQFEDAFRIPVPEDIFLTFDLVSYKNGPRMSEPKINGLDNESVAALQFGFTGVYFDGAYYIAMYDGPGSKVNIPEMLDGTVLRIPVGQYREPVLTDTGVRITEGPLLDRMERWYVPDKPFELSTYQTLGLSEDGSVLYILSSDGSTMRVAALREGAPGPSEIDVPGIDSFNCSYFSVGSDLILYKPEEAFHCISRQPDGSFSYAGFPTGGSDKLLALVNGRSDYYKLAFDGRRLAVCGVATDQELLRTYAYLSPIGCFILVYTEEGLQYSSVTRISTLDTAGFPRGNKNAYGWNDLYIRSLSW